MLFAVFLSLFIGASLSQDCSDTVLVSEADVIAEGVASDPSTGLFYLSDFTNFLVTSPIFDFSYTIPTPYRGNLRAVDCSGDVVYASNLSFSGSEWVPDSVGVEVVPASGQFDTHVFATWSNAIVGFPADLNGSALPESATGIENSSIATNAGLANDLAAAAQTAGSLTLAVTDTFAINTGHVIHVTLTLNGGAITGASVNSTCYASNSQLNGNGAANNNTFPGGANGIAKIDDFLLVGSSTSGDSLPSAFFKFPITCNGDNATVMEYDSESNVEGPALAPVFGETGVDGIFYDSTTEWMYFVSREKLFRACSRDNWDTIFVESEVAAPGGATVTAVGYDAYVAIAFTGASQQTLLQVSYEDGVDASEGCVPTSDGDGDSAPQLTWLF